MVKSVADKLNVGEDAVKSEVEYILAMEHSESILDRVLSYSSIIKDGRWSPSQYLKAVEYVTYRIADMSQLTAWAKCFPDRMINERNQRKPEGTMRALASLYDRGELVQKIMAQVQIPLHVLMMGERVTAAGVLANLMIHGETERIQMESADKLLNHIRVPETHKIELDIGFQADDTLVELNDKLDALANMAQAKIKGNHLTPTQVIES